MYYNIIRLLSLCAGILLILKGCLSMTPTVCVVFGGKSSEHEVSCMSAYNVITNLDRNKYKLLLVGIRKTGESFLYTGPVEHIKDGTWEENPGKMCVISSNPAHGGVLVMNKNGDTFTEHVDVYFPVLHGKYGEDGSIQGLFEITDIPYVGTGVTSSAVCMDKIITKKILATEGIPVVDGFSLTRREASKADKVDEKIRATIGYPVVIKPANAGSSVGISACDSKESLEAALVVATNEDRRILVEKKLNVREIECAVLGSYEDVSVSCAGEIVAGGMYDYDTKYVNNTARTVAPAPLDDDTAEQIRTYAEKAFRALDCTDMARVDFFVEKDTGNIFLNEVNTIPGFTDISMYPVLWQASGLDNSALLDKLIQLALQDSGRE